MPPSAVGGGAGVDYRRSTCPDIWAMESVFDDEEEEDLKCCDTDFFRSIFPAKFWPEFKRFSYLSVFLVR